jgi:hypothetical protein
MFGNGSSGENAYILVYRQKKMCLDVTKDKQKPTYPVYWNPFVAELNALNQSLRKNYAELEN